MSTTSLGPEAGAIVAYYSALERYWHPVVTIESVAGQPIGVELLGRPLVLVRLEGVLSCFEDLCRHLGTALSIGEIVNDGCHLRCAYHGWTYDKTGRVVDIPARRDLPIPREARVRAYHVREAYGLAWICLAEHPATEIPRFPEYGDERFHKTPLRAYPPWRASAPRVVMGALDDTHFPWVHEGVLGDRSHPEPPDHKVFREGDELVSTYTMLQPANASISGQEADGELEPVTYTNYVTPTTIRLVKEGPAGTYVIWHTASPLAYDKTAVFLHMARDFDLDPEHDQGYLEFEDVIQSQDRPVVESQRPWLLPPLSSRLLLYIRPADLPLIAFQKWLEELGIPQI
jgi:vanillate O-demethylase monooxygenase subunit